MSDLEIDFEWPVAKYEYQPASAAEIKRYEALSDRDRSWHWDQEPLGYLVRKGKAVGKRPTSNAMEMAVRLLVEREKIPLHVVVLKIARVLGGLLPQAKCEPVNNWTELSDYLRLVFKGGERRDDEARFFRYKHTKVKRIGEVGIYLVPDGTGGSRLALRPDSLYSALELCAARMVATGTTFHTCEHCSTPFLGGGAGRGSKKKRSDARFCSDKCRWTHHNKVRLKAR